MAERSKNSVNIGFEKQIWDAACVLRGHIGTVIDDAMGAIGYEI